MAELSTNVRYIKGIGETRAKALEKLGITTLRDLIGYFPRTYEDRTLTRPIRDLTEGENVCVRAMIAADPTAHRIPGGRTIVRTRAVDETGTLDVVFFNQEYRKNSLHRGEIYIFYGKVEGQRRHQMVNPLLEPEGRQHPDRAHHAHLLPDGRHQPADADSGGAAGTGRLPGAAAGRAAG